VDGDARLGFDAGATRLENSTRSTARACPAGTAEASASASRKLPARRISCFSSQGAVFSDSDLKRVGADQLRRSPRSGGLGGARGAHLVERDFAAEGRGLESSFRGRRVRRR